MGRKTARKKTLNSVRVSHHFEVEAKTEMNMKNRWKAINNKNETNEKKIVRIAYELRAFNAHTGRYWWRTNEFGLRMVNCQKYFFVFILKVVSGPWTNEDCIIANGSFFLSFFSIQIYHWNRNDFNANDG